MRKNMRGLIVRKHMHRGLVSLLCMCLLISCIPLIAFSEYSEPEASVGESGSFIEGQATTTVNLLAVGLEIIGQTENITTSLENINKDSGLEPDKQMYVLKVVLSGANPENCTYVWSRTIGESQPADAAFNDTRAVYPLVDAAHAGQLQTDEVYYYTVKVTDSKSQATASATIRVAISDTYEMKTLTNAYTTISVTGAINKALDDSSLSTSILDSSSPTYALLQEAAQGKKIENAWQVALVGSLVEGAPTSGKLSVSFPVSSFAAEGSEVTIVGLDAGGTIQVYTETVKNGRVVVQVDALGAFAVATPAKATYKIEATATEGGQITPQGETTYAAGATPTYTILPDSGYVLDEVAVDGQVVELAGNTYTFESLADNHTIHASFTEIPPEPAKEFTVVAQVQGTGGRVGIDGSTAESTCTKRVLQGESALIQFVPDTGYVIDTVALQVGTAPAVPVVVLNNTYLLSAVQDNTTIEVTYKLGVTPPVVVHEVSTEIVQGQGSISPESVQVPHGNSATFTLMPAAGYHVDYVEVDGKRIAVDELSVVVENVIADCTVNVAFAPDAPPHAVVRAQAGMGGSISPAGDVHVPLGTSQTFAFLPHAGWEVDAVRVNGQVVQTGGTSYTLVDVREGASVSVSFKVSDAPSLEYCPVQVTVAGNEGGAISTDESFFVLAGASKTLYAYAEDGFKLEEVLVNGEPVPFAPCSSGKEGRLGARIASQKVAAYSFVIPEITEETLIEVRFASTSEPPSEQVDTWKVEAQASTGGMISPSGIQTIPDAGRAEFTLKADAGYHLVSLVKEVEGSEPEDITGVLSEAGQYVIDAVSENTKLQATFASDYVTVHARAHEGGSISPAGDTQLVRGGSQTFTLLPEPGYEVDTVSLDGAVVQTGGATYALSNVQADHSVEVSFKPAGEVAPELFSISATVSGSGGKVSPEGSVSVAKGSSAAFSFIPDAGYQVASVKVDGVALPYQPTSYLFTNVQANHSLEVTFRVQLVPGTNPEGPWYKLDVLYKQLAQTGDVPRGIWVGLVALFAAAVAVAARGACGQKRKGTQR